MPGRKPLIVVTAGRGHDVTWQAAQNKLATLSTNSRHRVVRDATHASLILDQTHSARSQPGNPRCRRGGAIRADASSKLRAHPG